MAYNFVGFRYHFQRGQIAQKQDLIRSVLRSELKIQNAYRWEKSIAVREGRALPRSPGALGPRVIRNLKKHGVSYRRTNMLEDFQRADAIEISRSPAAKERAEKWFDTVEQARKRLGLRSRKEAIEFVTRMKDKSFKTIEEAQTARDLEALGVTGSPQ